jgi:hypothetical protein
MAKRDNPFVFLISSDLAPSQFEKHLHDMIDAHLDMTEGLSPKSIQFTDKYDYLLTPDLLVKQYVNNQISNDELRNSI